MPTTGVFEIRSSRGATDEPPLQCQLIDDLPGVPALPETLLLMELRMSEFSVDLHEISQLILGDLGATLQVYRLAAREHIDAEDRPCRMEDCISSLGLDACLRAAAATSSAGDGCLGPIIELWAHSREVAQNCSELAEKSGSMSAEEAYQVGLFHGLGLLPSLLGWSSRPSFQTRTRAASRLARQWSLPACVQQYLREDQRPGEQGPWDEIVNTAHQKARRSPVCSSPSGGLMLYVQRKL